MQLNYTKEGFKITHPTGVIQILSIEDLKRLKKDRERYKTENDEEIARLNTYIIEAQKVK